MDEDFKENIVCEDCGEEYTILYSTSADLMFCPFCGSDILYDEDEIEGEDEEEDDD